MNWYRIKEEQENCIISYSIIYRMICFFSFNFIILSLMAVNDFNIQNILKASNIFPYILILFFVTMMLIIDSGFFNFHSKTLEIRKGIFPFYHIEKINFTDIFDINIVEVNSKKRNKIMLNIKITGKSKSTIYEFINFSIIEKKSLVMLENRVRQNL